MSRAPCPGRGLARLLLAVLLAVAGFGGWQYLGWVLRADRDHARALVGHGWRLAGPLACAVSGYAIVFLLAWCCFYPAWQRRRRLLPLALGLWLAQLPASRPGLLDLAARHLSKWSTIDGYALYPDWFGWLVLLAWWAWLVCALRFWVMRLAGARHRRVAAVVGCLCLIGWLGWPWLALPRLPQPLTEPTRPNILILAADSLRADHLGCYGYRRAVSPNIDRLAATGTRFDAAFTDTGGTLPGWATTLSGQTAPRHGLRFHFPHASALRAFERNPARLAARLASAGYHTAVSSDWAGDSFAQVDFGFETARTFAPKGLEVYLYEGLYRCHPLLALTLCRSPVAPLFPSLSRSRVLLHPESLTDQTVGLIERLGGGARPFFLVHFGSAPHYPYLAARDQAGRFNDPAYRGTSRYRLNWSVDRQLYAGVSVSAAEQRQARALYDAAIATFDRRAGRILRALRMASRRPTLVVLISDHGEAFFERPGLAGHGADFAPGDPVYRVPVIIQGLGLPAGRIGGVVRTIDLAPTIAELAGCRPAAGWQGESLVGEMLRGRLTSPRAAYAETTYMFAPPRYPWALVARSGGSPALQPSDRPRPYLQLRPELVDSVVAAKLKMLRTGRYKLIRIPSGMGPVELLFDVVADPGCTTDLSARLPDRRTSMSRLLDKWRTAR